MIVLFLGVLFLVMSIVLFPNFSLVIFFQILGYILISLYFYKKKEKYFPDYQKDYASAMRVGYVVGGGSVYARNPEVNYPGLGWIN